MNIKEIFDMLKTNWKDETQFLSSSTEIHNNKNYQEIIRLGPKVLPYILNDLKVSDGLWFNALSNITGLNPIPPNYYGNFNMMRDIWLSWGRENKYI